MDVHCPLCGEPFDVGEFHYMDGKTYKEAYSTFFEKGCRYMWTDGEQSCKAKGEERKNEIVDMRKKYNELEQAWKAGLKNGIFLKNEYDLGPSQWKEVKHPIDGGKCYSWDIETELWTLEEDIRSLSQLVFKMDASSVSYELLGDDIDGIASSMEDL